MTAERSFQEVRMRKSLIVLAAGMPFAAAGAAGAGPEEDPGNHEMETYYVGLIYRGPSWTPEQTPETAALQEAHLANIRRLAGSGTLVLAGPFTDGGDLRGMFVFHVGTIEEAAALCDSDPAVKAGRLRVELHPWYSAKGIGVAAKAEGGAQ
jgi:uncharacterized protein YciI